MTSINPGAGTTSRPAIPVSNCPPTPGPAIPVSNCPPTQAPIDRLNDGAHQGASYRDSLKLVEKFHPSVFNNDGTAGGANLYDTLRGSAREALLSVPSTPDNGVTGPYITHPGTSAGEASGGGACGAPAAGGGGSAGEMTHAIVTFGHKPVDLGQGRADQDPTIENLTIFNERTGKLVWADNGHDVMPGQWQHMKPEQRDALMAQVPEGMRGEVRARMDATAAQDGPNYVTNSPEDEKLQADRRVALENIEILSLKMADASPLQKAQLAGQIAIESYKLEHGAPAKDSPAARQIDKVLAALGKLTPEPGKPALDPAQATKAMQTVQRELSLLNAAQQPIIRDPARAQAFQDQLARLADEKAAMPADQNHVGQSLAIDFERALTKAVFARGDEKDAAIMGPMREKLAALRGATDMDAAMALQAELTSSLHKYTTTTPALPPLTPQQFEAMRTRLDALTQEQNNLSGRPGHGAACRLEAELVRAVYARGDENNPNVMGPMMEKVNALRNEEGIFNVEGLEYQLSQMLHRYTGCTPLLPATFDPLPSLAPEVADARNAKLDELQKEQNNLSGRPGHGAASRLETELVRAVYARGDENNALVMGPMMEKINALRHEEGIFNVEGLEYQIGQMLHQYVGSTPVKFQ